MEYDGSVLLQELAALAGIGVQAVLAHGKAGLAVNSKPDGELVTQADIASSEAIVNAASQECPGIPVHSEEHPLSDWLSYDEVLVVDPLDGTTNFVRQIPFSSVSVAMVRRGVPVAGVIAPLSGGWYFSVEGKGSYFGAVLGQTDGAKRLRCAERPLGSAVLAITCNQNDTTSRDQWWEWMRRLRPPQCFRLRIVESAAIELGWVASGHIDGYLHPSDKPWDLAAGALIAKEADVELYSPALRTWEFATLGVIALVPSISTVVLDILSQARD